MKIKIKKNYPLILAPVLTLFSIGIFFAVYNAFPFGDKTISWCDMNQQTVPLLMELKNILDGKSNLLYSTGNAGGMNFWGVFLFFIASPLYLTVKFVSKSQLIYLVNILFAVKLSLCAFTSAIYLKSIHKKLHNSFCVILSIMYAFCGYGVMYCQTLVWLDIMALFPLLILGIEKMCRNNKPVLYCIILILMMTINFYLTYMTVIYVLLSVPLFIHIRCKKSERKKAGISFAWSSLISLLITAPVWLCTFFQITSSARSENTITELMYKPLFENGANKFSVIMCTALIIAVLPFFIKNKISKIPEIKYNLLVLMLLAIPIFIDPINKMWHMGSYQSFPFRYGFIVIFTMITLTAHYFEHIDIYGKTSKKFAGIILLMTAFFIILCIYIVNSKRTILSSYINTLRVDKRAFKFLFAVFILGCMIYIISIMLQRRNLLGRRMLCLIISGVFLGEAYTSLSINIGYAVNDGDVFKTSAVLEYDSTGEPYYRTKTEKKYLHVNMLGGLGYNSFAHYTSLTSESYMFTMKKLGYSSYWMEVGSNGGTVFTDALLGIKNSIGTYGDFNSYYKITDLIGDLDFGVSNICCTAGIINDVSPEECKTLENKKRVDTQKELSKNFLGTSEMFYEYEPSLTVAGDFEYSDSKFNVTASDSYSEVCQLRYTIDVKGRQVLYFDLFDNLSNDLSEVYYGASKIYVNGECLTSDYPNQKNNGIMTLGEFEDTTVEILIAFQKDISVRSLGVFGIDIDILKSHIDKLNSEKGCDLFADGNKISGQCSSLNGEWLYMSVPYDKGLKSYVNGKNTPIIKVNDSFCAVKLDKGENFIELKFVPYGMTAAIIISIFGLILCILWIIFGVKKIYKIKAAGKISIILCNLMFGFIILIIYILPLIIRFAVIISEII